MKEQNSEMLSRLNEISKSASRQFSTVARSITMALCALTWLELFGPKENRNLNKDIILISVVLLVIVYFIVDILQYYISCKTSNNNWQKYKKGYITISGVSHSMNSLNRCTYKMLDAKIAILAIICILLVVYFVKTYLIK